MSIVVLDAMDGSNAVTDKIKESLVQSGRKFSYFQLKDKSILPCRSCGACGFKSPGRCVLKDDSHEILGAIARCSTLIMLTPIRFGGYNSTLKKAVDKFMTLGLPAYKVKNGHMLHPMRYGSKSIVGIGVYEGDSMDQADCFRKLVENNAFNLDSEYRTLVLKPSGNMEEMEREIGSLIKEVAHCE